jgi:Protein of unknown function (DUF732)
MRKYLKHVACTITALTLALLGAPVAQADNASFVAQAHALGFVQWDDVLIRMGLSACRFLQPNLRRNPEDVSEHIMRHTNVEPDQAHQFLVMSVNEYCPQLAYRVSA